MPENFISKMAKYVAFLYREADIWEQETDNRDAVSLFEEDYFMGGINYEES